MISCAAFSARAEYAASFAADPAGLEIRAAAAGPAGNLIVAGAVDFTNNLSNDAFVAKLDAGLTQRLAFVRLPGAQPDAVDAVAVDAAGNVFVAGHTDSADFAATAHAFDTGCGTDGKCNGLRGDLFVAKFDAALSTFLAATFLGGGSSESIAALAIASDGSVVVAGETDSEDFPIPAGAYQTSFPGHAPFVARLSNDLGSLLAATFLGGYKTTPRALAAGADGSVWLAGGTRDGNFPVTPGAYDRALDTSGGFVARLDAGLAHLVASTFLPIDVGGLALDPRGGVLVAGPDYYVEALGHSLPVTSGLYAVEGDAIAVARLDEGLTRVTAAIEISAKPTGPRLWVGAASNGNVHLAGGNGSPEAPLCTGAWRGGSDVLVAVFDAALTAVVASASLGGAEDESVVAAALGPDGTFYAAGSTTSPDFPVSSGAYQAAFSAPSMPFVAVIGPSAAVGTPVPFLRAREATPLEAFVSTWEVHNLGGANLVLGAWSITSSLPKYFTLDTGGGGRPCGQSPSIPPGGYCTFRLRNQVTRATCGLKYGAAVWVDTNDPHASHAMVGHLTGSSDCAVRIDEPGLCSSGTAAVPGWAAVLAIALRTAWRGRRRGCRPGDRKRYPCSGGEAEPAN